MKRLPALLLVVLTTAPVAPAAVDAGKHNDDFDTEPGEERRIEIERAKTGESRPAGSDMVEFATVPASDAKLRRPGVREKKRAPIDMTARGKPVQTPGQAKIKTGRSAPEKLQKKYEAPMADRYQLAMTDAARVTTTKTRAQKNDSILRRINRFLFRRNEPPPTTTSAGGPNEPGPGAPEPQESGGS